MSYLSSCLELNKVATFEKSIYFLFSIFENFMDIWYGQIAKNYNKLGRMKIVLINYGQIQKLLKKNLISVSVWESRFFFRNSM